jgi:hypothetical protein
MDRFGVTFSATERQQSIFWFAGYFIAAFFIGLFVRDIMGQPHLWDSISNFMRPDVQQYGDPGTFAEAARDIYHNGHFTTTAWATTLWPPGFMVLEASVLRIFGENAPFIVILIVILSLLFATLMSATRSFLLTKTTALVASIVPLLVLAMPIVRTEIEPMGIVLSEGFATALFFLALVLVLQALDNASWRLAVIAGAILGLSAYMRSQFETITTFLLIGALVFAVWYAIRRFLQHRNAARILLLPLLVILVAESVMVPWRIHNYRHLHNIGWVQTDLLYVDEGRTDAQLNAINAGWLVEGGGNLMCELDPNYCGKADKNLFFQSLFTHIVPWYEVRFRTIGAYWFAALGSLVGPEPGDWQNFALNALYLLCMIATIPLLILRRKFDAMGYLWFTSAFYVCFLLILSLIHYEARYFYLLKIFAVFTTILLVTSVVSERRGIEPRP